MRGEGYTVHYLGDRHRLNAWSWFWLLTATGLFTTIVVWLVFAYVQPSLRLQNVLKRLVSGDWDAPMLH